MHSSIRPNRLPLWLKVGLAVAFVLTFGMGSTFAGQLQVGPNPTPPGGYLGNFYNSETNDIGNGTALDVYHTAASGDSLVLSSNTTNKDGFLLLVGIPNDTTKGGNGGEFFSSNPITSSNGNLASSTYFGGTWSTSSPTTGFAGLFTSSGAKDPYVLAGLPDPKGGSSENWSNWSTWDAHIGVTANNFGIYVFEIDATLSGKQSEEITFNAGSLPQGTFVIAYGQTSSGDSYFTPFTQAGITTSNSGGGGPGGGAVPAPPSVVLLGFGGFGLTFILARSRRRLAAA